MADKKPKPEKKAKDGKEKKSGGKRKILVFALIAAGIAIPGAGLIMLAGLLPSLVISLTDSSRGKALTVCVASLNAAGVLHVLLGLMQHGFAFEYALSLVYQPQAYIIMWGAAALGFSFFTFIPGLVAQAMAGMAEGKITRLRYNQQELKRLWGDQVGGD
jgi:hypothetical protein